jgi:hypothetical protein
VNYVGIDPHKQSIVLCVMNQDSRTPARLSPEVVGRMDLGGLMAVVSPSAGHRRRSGRELLGRLGEGVVGLARLVRASVSGGPGWAFWNHGGTAVIVDGRQGHMTPPPLPA